MIPTLSRLPLLAALCLVGACERAAPPPAPPALDAPSGQGTYLDGAGVRRPLFTTLAVLSYDQTVEGELPPAASLVGYEFFAEAGDAPRLELADPGGAALLAVYGPRGAEGLWGEPVAVVEGEGALSLALEPLRTGGAWFVLLRDRAARPRPYRLTLRCAGCAPPACAAAPCDRFCAAGFELDAEGCRQCACVGGEPAPCDPACGPDARCEDGACVPLDCADACPPDLAPVCGADRRTYPNACLADCAGVATVARGPCPSGCGGPDDCPEGTVCEGARCVPDRCGCPLIAAPACSAEGNSYRNRCLLECAGEAFAYEGTCVRQPCRTAQGCPAGAACVVAALPGNPQRCRADPLAADCVRECRVQRCQGHLDCGPGGRCFDQGGEWGLCVARCRPGGADCAPPGRCAEGLIPDEPGAGVCLPGCGPDGACPAPLECAPDGTGAPTCQLPCPPDRPDCRAEAPADCEAACPLEWAPVCGDDGLLYVNDCRAECARRRHGDPGRCYRGQREVITACRVDADCAPTGCDGSVCASARTDACSRLSPAAACFTQLGSCGCDAGTCGWRPGPRTEDCLERLRRAQRLEPAP